MGNVAYRVVGLCNDKGDSGEKPALIPFSTLQTIYNKGDKLSCLTIATKNMETIEANNNFEKSIGKRWEPTTVSILPTTAPYGYGISSPIICNNKKVWPFYVPEFG